MASSSEDEDFYDAIGDEAQIQEMKKKMEAKAEAEKQEKSQEIISETSQSGTKQNKGSFQDEQETREESKNSASEKFEQSSVPEGMNNLRQNPATTGRKSLLEILQKKRRTESEFIREDVKQHDKNESNFENLLCLQFVDAAKKPNTFEMESHSKKEKGHFSTWVAKFSPDVKHLATGGSDGILRVFRVTIFEEKERIKEGEPEFQVLDPNFRSFIGHKLDIVDISWFKDSKLVLTSSIDKTVILWDTESQELVKLFEHSDIVSCVSFHPVVDEFFATGCFDKIIRVWDLNETKVVDWVQTNDIVTALTFSPDKAHLLVGFYKGTIKIYRIDQGKLKFVNEITCKNAFSWGKVNKVGKKVTSIIFTEELEFLVMTNDSRMRLIDFKTFKTKVKYKGHTSGKFHIQPSYNAQNEMILSGSEDGKTYIWNKANQYIPQIGSIDAKKNRNTCYEHFKPFKKANTTCTLWLPFTALKLYQETIMTVWKEIYVDKIMVLFSSDSKIKVVGNLIELEVKQDGE